MSPRATTTSDQERFELKSCPDGYVVLRRMTYGEFLHRRDLAAKFSMEARRGQRDMKIDTEIMQQKVAAYEFSTCVVEHNLEDENGNLLDFKNPRTIEVLDPRIGQEINQLIDQMNQWEADEELFSESGAALS